MKSKFKDIINKECIDINSCMIEKTIIVVL